MLAGITPCKLFQLRFRVSRDDSRPSSDGTGPIRSFEFKKSFRSRLRLPRDGGISPVRRLPCRNNSSRFLSCPRDSGMAPKRREKSGCGRGNDNDNHNHNAKVGRFGPPSVRAHRNQLFILNTSWHSI